MVPELKQLPYDQRLEKLNLWTLEERRFRADLIEVYKLVTRCHLPLWITQCYLPPDTSEHISP